MIGIIPGTRSAGQVVPVRTRTVRMERGRRRGQMPTAPGVMAGDSGKPPGRVPGSVIDLHEATAIAMFANW